MTDKKTLHKLFTAAILLIAVALCFLVPQAFRQTAAYASSGDGWVLGNVDVIADVGENKVIRVTETIEVGFQDEGQTKFSRRVLIRYSSARAFGGVLENRKNVIARISDISATVNGEVAAVSDYIYGDYLNITIENPGGSAFNTEQGSVNDLYTIVLSYNYDISFDVVQGYDDLIFEFFNEKSFRYYEQRQRLTLTLNMPKSFDGSSVTVRNKDTAEEWQYDKENGDGYFVSGSTVRMKAHVQGLKYLTLQIILPEGYFDIVPVYYSYYWIFFAVTCAAIAATCIVAFKYRKRKPVAPLEFYPPDVNLLHFSGYWHGLAKRKDVCTVIFQWAQAGCVRIIRDGKKDVILEKLRNLPKGRRKAERKYFEALFCKGDRYFSREIRKISNFTQACRIHSAVSGLVADAGSPEIFVKGVKRARIAVLFIAIAASLVSMIYFILLYPNITYWLFFGFTAVCTLAFTIPLYKKFAELRELKEAYSFVYKFGSYILFLFASVVFVLYWLLLAGVYMPAFDYAGLIYINVIWIFVCALVMPRIIGERTDEAQLLYGRMLGFRRFILTAELPRIEALSDENPGYFYDILPYCMIMGISNKLDKRLERMQLAAPEWSAGFNPANIAASLFNSAKSALKGRRGEKGNNRKEV